MKDVNAIEMRGVTKRFGEVVANKDVNLDVRHGEILAILGENGSGKTTLMNMIAGIYYPDEGQMLVNGEEVVIRSPKDAFRHKIGMIHQHFKLVDVFTAAENVILGIKEEAPELPPVTGGNGFVRVMRRIGRWFQKLWAQRYSTARVEKRVAEIAARYGFDVDPAKKIYDMAVSEKQTVEIIKVLYRGADILILDEPTAVLTPQETQKLFAVLRRMKEDGKSIVIITHKLHEVLSISDRVAILRKGEHIATVDTCDATEASLTEMMVGKKVELNIDRADVPENPVKRLWIEGLSCKDREGVTVLDDINFHVNAGEILGIAGIAGSGQRELLEAIAGLQHIETGDIYYHDPETNETVDLRERTPLQIRELGVRLSFVPEDRLGMGLVGNMDITDNMMLRSYREGHSMFLDRTDSLQLAERIIDELEVVTPGTTTPVRRLSGGNVQKVLVGREIAAAPTVLMAAYPVRGLDINSSYTIYNLLNQQKQNGVAVIFVGEDLDVLIELCDRILVIGGGRVTGVVEGRGATKEEIGLLMTKTEGGSDDE